MKTILVAIFLTLSSLTMAASIEGQLISKLTGELDPYALGDGCLSIVEYYEHRSDKFLKIGIYESKVENCISSETEEGEEIDFNFKKLKAIRSKQKLKALKEIAAHILREKDTIRFFQL